MDVLALIPARGGSKGLPGKNIKELNGRPLISYAIEVAQNCPSITDIAVTTDSLKISSVSEYYGAEVIHRPDELAKDDSLVMDAIRHAVDTKQKCGKSYDLLVLLEPTAPFRTVQDVDETIELLVSNNADAAATFSETEVPPSRTWKIKDNQPEPFIPGSDPFLPRQKHTKGYALNGVVYVLKVALLNKYPNSTSLLMGTTIANIIPKGHAVDIDTEMDFQFAEFLLQKNSRRD